MADFPAYPNSYLLGGLSPDDYEKARKAWAAQAGMATLAGATPGAALLGSYKAYDDTLDRGLAMSTAKAKAQGDLESRQLAWLEAKRKFDEDRRLRQWAESIDPNRLQAIGVPTEMISAAIATGDYKAIADFLKPYTVGRTRFQPGAGAIAQAPDEQGNITFYGGAQGTTPVGQQQLPGVVENAMALAAGKSAGEQIPKAALDMQTWTGPQGHPMADYGANMPQFRTAVTGLMDLLRGPQAAPAQPGAPGVGITDQRSPAPGITDQRSPVGGPMTGQSPAELAGAQAAIRSWENTAKSVIESGRNAQKVHQLGTMMQEFAMSPNVPQGKMAPMLQWLKEVGASFGFVDPGVPEAEALESFNSQMALLYRSPSGEFGGLTGNTSERDLAFLRAMSPSLAQTRVGRKLLADVLVYGAQASMEYGRLASEITAQIGSGAPIADALRLYDREAQGIERNKMEMLQLAVARAREMAAEVNNMPVGREADALRRLNEQQLRDQQLLEQAQRRATRGSLGR